jgi:hypothetical protein
MQNFSWKSEGKKSPLGRRRSMGKDNIKMVLNRMEVKLIRVWTGSNGEPLFEHVNEHSDSTRGTKFCD